MDNMKNSPSLAKILTNIYGVIHIALGLGIFVYFVFLSDLESILDVGIGIVIWLLVLSGIMALKRSKAGFLCVILGTLWVSFSAFSVIQDYYGPQKFNPEDIVYFPAFAIYEWISTIAIAIEIKRRRQRKNIE